MLDAGINNLVLTFAGLFLGALLSLLFNSPTGRKGFPSLSVSLTVFGSWIMMLGVLNTELFAFNGWLVVGTTAAGFLGMEGFYSLAKAGKLGFVDEVVRQFEDLVSRLSRSPGKSWHPH